MGFMSKISSVFGGKKETETEQPVKGPSATLRDHGIDPSRLKFKFHQDNSITVTGEAASEAECNRICEVVGTIPNVSNVTNNITIATPVPVPEPETEADVSAAESGSEEGAARTYTVKSGDTLWAIAEQMYGSGGKYMKIFEANTSVLENPDKIFPGQELVIPDID